MLCSSSEIVRIFNFHTISTFKNPTECTARILGFEEFELKDYFHDFLSHHNDPVFKKQFDEMDKLISNEIPEYGGKQRLLNVILRLIIGQKMPIPIKSLWTKTKKFDFHYYCSTFWSTVWKSIDPSLEHKRKTFDYFVRINETSELFRTCNHCGEKFASFSATKRHKVKYHDLKGPYLHLQFPDLVDSESDSEEDKWTSIRCNRCYELFLTQETYRNHLTFHNERYRSKNDISNDNGIENDESSDAESNGSESEETSSKSSLDGTKLSKMIEKVDAIKCTLCDAIYLTREEHRDHFDEVHRSQLEKSQEIALELINAEHEQSKNRNATSGKRQRKRKSSKKAKGVVEAIENKNESIADANYEPVTSMEESSSVEIESQDSKSENSEHVQDTLEGNFDETEIKDFPKTLEDPTLDISHDLKDFEHNNEVIDVSNVEGASGISGSNDDICKYIDSLELEIRCLKMSQQFFESTKKENQSLKRQVKELEYENQEMSYELRNLKESAEELQKCKICMEGKLEIVFIPCGHIFSCTNCAPSCKNCPLCRKPAKHMKIYFP